MISVVVPTYNAQRWLEATLVSVLSQQYSASGIEVVVVDDASTDASAVIARQVLDRYPSIRSLVVVQNRNSGVSAARNVGLRKATGTWIQFLDADDLLGPGKFGLHAEAASSAASEVGVLYSDWQHLAYMNGDWHRDGPIVCPSVDDNTVERILDDFDFGYVGPTLIRKSFLERIGGFDERLRLGEDLDVMLRLAMSGARFHKVAAHDPVYFYRQTPGSLSQGAVRDFASTSSLADMLRGVECWLRSQTNEDLSLDARNALARRYGRCLDVLFELDRPRFREVMGWIVALGADCPPDARPSIRLASRFIGYESALRVRSVVRLLAHGAKPGLAPLRMERPRAEPAAKAEIS
jgi:glycosyltransferase involved in cell wall biosynthesis